MPEPQDHVPATAQGSRDHFVLSPQDWAGAASDVGRRHRRNQDAVAVAAGADDFGSQLGVVVVSDGVSTSLASDQASQVAAETACAALVAAQKSRLGDDAEQIADDVSAAFAAANARILEEAGEAPPGSYAATMTIAIWHGGRVLVGNVGDSRAYWCPDDEPAVLLTVDDSLAQARINLGVSREVAETGAQAHAITKWLGPDSPDATPSLSLLELAGPGWLLVCSDGLWNYASDPETLAGIVRQAAQQPADQTAAQVSSRLVDWANEQGGRDNISVALTRLVPLR